MEKKKSVLYQDAFLTLKRGFLILAAVMIAGGLLSLALLDDVKLADKTVQNIDLVTLTDKTPVNAEIFKESTLTVVNVWATFCGPCIREMPEFGEVSREYADKGVQFLGVCGDITYDADGSPNAQLLSDAFQIIETTKADYPHCMPTPAYAPQLGTLISNSYPGTFIVDSNGNILKLFVGGITKDVLVSAIETALSTSQDAGSGTEAQA